MAMKEVTRPDWMALLDSILDKPGILGDYYFAFHNYSIGNQAIAVCQMVDRGIEIGPIASFNSWKKKGRSVIKGQKAIGLFMPVTLTGKSRADKDDDSEPAQPGVPRRIFVMRNNWFALSQTQVDPAGAEEGGEASAESVTEDVAEQQWSQSLALSALGVTMIPFKQLNGNIQGYAVPSQASVAISPLAAFPHKTMFHELAHCLLHSDEVDGFVCGTDLSSAVKEVEAESVAYICCSALNLEGLEFSRGYIQSWMGGAGNRDMLKKSAGRIFSAADRILKAGFPKQEKLVEPTTQQAAVAA